MWTEGVISGVVVRDLKLYDDERGWLAELYREDETQYRPKMAYVSMTLPGVQRGPHEHRHQTDLFYFVTSKFRVTLYLVNWTDVYGGGTKTEDTRKREHGHEHSERASLGTKMVVEGGHDRPISVLVPPGVVHAYENIGGEPGLVLNFPDSLYRGEKKSEDVDEIRYEGSKVYA